MGAEVRVPEVNFLASLSRTWGGTYPPLRAVYANRPTGNGQAAKRWKEEEQREMEPRKREGTRYT